MDIIKYDVYRGPNIGIYTAVNDKFVFMPNGFTKSKASALASYLGVDYMRISVGNTRVLGSLMITNNHGMLLPRTADPDEINALKSTGLNVEILPTKYNALGNMISANDRGAIVSPLLDKSSVRSIEDVLDVEAVQKRIAGYNQVGAMARSNSHGGVIHPETDEEDVKVFSNVLGVQMEPVTVNGGVPFVSSGMLVNNNTAIVGSFTTGPEIMMLTRAFVH